MKQILGAVLALSILAAPGAIVVGASTASAQTLADMNNECKGLYRRWVRRKNIKAFAVSREGDCGFSWDFDSVREARQVALEECRSLHPNCRVADVRGN